MSTAGWASASPCSAAVVVAPSGTRVLVRSAWVWLRRQGARTRGQLARFLPFLRRDLNVQGVTASIGVGLGGVGTLTVSGRAWHPTASVDERIEALHQHITEVEGQLIEVSQQLSQETSKRERALAELEAGLRAETAELRRLLEEQEHRAARVDARGLPVIALGIVLSGIPDQLASIPYGIGWVAPVLGIAAAVAAGVPPGGRHTQRRHDPGSFGAPIQQTGGSPQGTCCGDDLDGPGPEH